MDPLFSSSAITNNAVITNHAQVSFHKKVYLDDKFSGSYLFNAFYIKLLK